MKRLALTLVVLAVAGVGADASYAHHLTGSPVVSSTGTPQVSPEVWAELLDRAVRPTTVDPVAAPQTTVDSKVWRMRTAARILPKLSTLGTLSLAATAFGLGWQIGGTAQPTIFNLIAGDIGTSPSLGSGEGPLEWEFEDSSQLDTGFAPDPPTSEFWRLRSQSCVLFYDPPHGTFGCANDVDAAGMAAAANADATVHENESFATEFAFTLTSEAMEEKLQVQAVDSTAYTAYSGPKVSTSYNAPGDLGTTADKQAAAAPLGTGTAHTAGAPGEIEKAVEEALCVEAGLTSCTPPEEEPFVLPQPLPNETYTAYVTRLEGLGWLGTATTVAETAALQEYGPEAVTRLQFETTPGTTRTLDPLRWPATSPTIQAGTDLIIRYNVETATPAPTEGGGVPGGDPDGGLSFDPLTEIDWGCRFPYGIFCYAIAFTELFDVEEDAPVFSFTLGFMGSAGVPAVGEAAYVVDLEVLDDYMSLWRSILSVCLWVGAIYWVATRFLGFQAGGDPGEAIDDVM